MSLLFRVKYLFDVKRKTDSIHVTENNSPLPSQNKTKKLKTNQKQEQQKIKLKKEKCTVNLTETCTGALKFISKVNLI